MVSGAPRIKQQRKKGLDIVLLCCVGTLEQDCTQTYFLSPAGLGGTYIVQYFSVFVVEVSWYKPFLLPLDRGRMRAGLHVIYFHFSLRVVVHPTLTE